MSKKCENCNRRIGIIRKIRKKFFQAKVFKYSPAHLFQWEENVYFCSNKCISEYEWTHPNVKILN
jgi:hypothetical protein